MENPNDFPPRPNLDAAGVDSATAPAPISTSAMPTPAPPSTFVMSTELPSTSAMPTPAPPTTSVVSTELLSTSAMPILAPPTTFAMPIPAPMSTSPRATIPAAGKSHKKPGHEAPKPGSKKSKKIATQFVEQDAAVDESAITPAPPSTSAMPTELSSTSAMTSGKSHKRPGSKKSKKIATEASPMIMTRSPVVNMLARSTALKRASSAVVFLLQIQFEKEFLFCLEVAKKRSLFVWKFVFCNCLVLSSVEEASSASSVEEASSEAVGKLAGPSWY